MLTQDAFLRLCKVEIELLTDIDMILLLEKGIRGGFSYVSTRYTESGYEENVVTGKACYVDIKLIDAVS
jgi:hypothetical protein